MDPDDKEKAYPEAVKRKKKHPDVEETLQTSNTYKQKFALAMSGGTPPDLFNS